MAESAAAKVRRLEKRDQTLFRRQQKLHAEQRKVEDKYRRDHEAYTEKDNKLREEIDANATELAKARREEQR